MAKKNRQVAELHHRLDTENDSIFDLKYLNQKLETQIANINNRQNMRHSNYYNSVVLEFFPNSAETFKQSLCKDD